MSATKSPLVAKVSHELCVGAGMCIGIAPAAFAFNSEGLAIFRSNSDFTEDQLREAADACPMAAITIVENLP